MTGSIPLFDLLPVKRAAETLYKSEQGVRRLVKSGKLKALREGGKLLIKAESLAAYVAGLPHPPEIMEAHYSARDLLNSAELYRRRSHMCGVLNLEALPDPHVKHFLIPVLPVCRDILAAVKVRDYPRVIELRAEVWRLVTDYRMLHAPYETPRRKAGREKGAPVVWELPSLFPELEGGKA